MMARTGQYELNETKKDTSFRNFICVLLLVLVLLVLVYIIMAYGMSSHKDPVSDITGKMAYISRNETTTPESFEGKTYSYIRGTQQTNFPTTTDTDNTSQPTNSDDSTSETGGTTKQTNPDSTTDTVGTTQSTNVSSTTETAGTTQSTNVPGTTETAGTTQSTNVPNTTDTDGTTQPTNVPSTTDTDATTQPTNVPSTTETAGTTQSTNVPNTTDTDGTTQPTNVPSTTDTDATTQPTNVPSTTETAGTTQSTNVPNTTDTDGTTQPTNVPSTTDTDATTQPTNVPSTTETAGTTQSTNVPNTTDTDGTTQPTNVPSTTDTDATTQPTNVPSTTETAGTTQSTNVPNTTDTDGTTQPTNVPSTTETAGTTQSTNVPSTTDTDATTQPTNVSSTTETVGTTQSTNVPSTTETAGTTQSTNVPNTTDTDGTTQPTTAPSTAAGTGHTSHPNNLRSEDTCDDPACKTVSSRWLAMINHDRNADPCKDFYNYACGELQPKSDNEIYFQHISKALVTKIKNNSKAPKYSKIFADFYESCYHYNDDFMMKDMLNNLISIEQKNLTEIIIDLILAQAMPFFDVGLRVNEDQSIGYELTLPGISSLRTSLSQWPLLERLKEQCIQKITDNFNDNNILYVDQTVSDINDCVKNSTVRQINEFVEGMEKMKELFDADLVSSFKNHTEDLKDLMTQYQGRLLEEYRALKYKNIHHETLSLNRMNRRHNILNVNWIDVFAGISRNVGITGNTAVNIIISTDYMRGVVKIFNNKRRIRGMLNLWYNLQLFKNARFGSNNGPTRATHCIKLASQLMPEISVSYVNEISSVDETMLEKYERVGSLFQQLKTRFGLSLREANFSGKSITILKKRLDKMRLRSNASNRFDSNILSQSSYENYLDISNESYHQMVMVLLKNYRRTVFSLVDKKYSEDELPEILLLYFVDSFDTEPRTFPPSHHIIFHPGFVNGISAKLPAYVELATKGFRLGQQLAKHFENDDFSDPDELDSREKRLYSQLKQNDEVERNLIDRIKYKIDNDQYDIRMTDGSSGTYLNRDEIIEDNAAFRLVSDSLINNSTTLLPYLEKTSKIKIFVTMIAHEFCKDQTLVDFVADLYRGKLPAPVKIRNIVEHSDFFIEQYNCQNIHNIDTYQFPHIVLLKTSYATKAN